MNAKTLMRSSPVKPVSRPATLTVFPLSRAEAKRMKEPYARLSLLIADNITLQHEGHWALGLAAAIAGVRIPDVKGPHLPEGGFRLHTSRSLWQQAQRHWHDLKLPSDVTYAVLRFHNGMLSALHSQTLAQSAFERVLEDEWPQALALVPEELRVITHLEPAVFGKDGYPVATARR
jgi:hypothetical protein